MQLSEIIHFLDNEFHPEYQENYDNSGFLLGNPDTEYTGALVAIDLTPDVIHEAVSLHANLIVTHHPFIFSGIKRITPANTIGSMIFSLIQNNIAVYAAHTNLDNLSNGVNGILAFQLGLTDCHILRPMSETSSPDIGAGMIGNLPYPIPVSAFIDHVKACLGLPFLRVSDLASPAVSRVAICGGSGSFLIDDAIRQHADIYLTGDIKYHDFQRAEGRITIADIGHYESEQFAKQLFYSVISKKFSNFACFISQQGRNFVNYM
ncbi:MAG: Nif3-like dinuclear metal center hexameric protein [Bacteroidales bacterium]|nr:Nif3-like dinuclear metal center hexameric protein [Bacteroidales bacterium]